MLELNAATIEETQSDELIVVNLYELIYDPNEAPLRYTNWDEPVSYGGNIYDPAVIKHSELTQSSDGKLNNVTLMVGNADRIIQRYIEEYDLIGKRVKVIQFFIGSASGQTQGTFKIKQVIAKKDTATFTLSIGIDYLRVQVPRRTASARHCGWQFRSAECGYEGADTDCEKTFEDCMAKGNIARIGCFPGIINEKIYV